MIHVKIGGTKFWILKLVKRVGRLRKMVVALKTRNHPVH
jgi:hypothetical protein